MALAWCLTAQAATFYKSSISNLRSETGMANGDLAFVEGYYSLADRGGGWFKYDSSSARGPDEGAVIAPNSGTGRWFRILKGEVANVQMWGAKGDGSSNDTDAFIHAVNGCLTNLNCFELYIPGAPPGYVITNTIIFRGEQLHLRGDQSRTLIRMPVGIQKDILRTANAEAAINGGAPVDLDHKLHVEDLGLLFDGNESTRNTNNACLVTCNPGEANVVRNITTANGAYGILCLGAGTPGLNLRDCSLNGASIAGLGIVAFTNGYSTGGPISVIGLSGDTRWDSSRSNSSLVLLSNVVANIQIQDVKAEAAFGGGLFQYKWPDSDWGLSDRMGAINIRNVMWNGGGTYGNNYPPLDVVVLKGGVRTASVTLQSLNLHAVRYLIRDEVGGQSLPPDIQIFSGLSQFILPLPISYQSATPDSNNTYTSYIQGQTAFAILNATNTGWYRILQPIGGSGKIAGKLTISSQYESTEVNIDITPGTSATQLTLERSPKYSTGPIVTQARAWWTGSRAVVDVYVGNPIPISYLSKRVTFTWDINAQQLYDLAQVNLKSPIVAAPEPPEDAVLTSLNLYR